MPTDVTLRPLELADAPMVYKTWLGVAWDDWRGKTDGCRNCNRRFSYVGKDAFMDGMHARVTRLLSRSTCWAICPASAQAGSDYMIGFLVRDPYEPVLHFVYVIKGGGKGSAQWRGLGIATAAMRAAFPRWPEEPITFTQDTAAMRAIKAKWKAQYNPFLVE